MNFELVLLSLCLHLVFSQYYDDTPEERRLGGNRRRPCVFRTKRKKGHNEGRTFLDWNFQHYDVSYNYNYNIDCSGSAGGGGNYQPGLLGSHFQGDTSNQQGLLGSHFQGGSNNKPGLLGSHFGSHSQGGGLLGSLFNRPQGGFINNIPGIPQIGNVISQTQSQSQADAYNSGGGRPGRPRPGQYFVASNPNLGSYFYDVSFLNPSNIFKQIGDGLNELIVEPLSDIFSSL